jgi:hypothetical protein
MNNFRAVDKSHAGGDEKHDINFHWPYIIAKLANLSTDSTQKLKIITENPLKTYHY